MSEQYPDIEIYLENPDVDELTHWLTDRFGLLKIKSSAHRTLIEFQHGDEHIPAVYLPKDRKSVV